MEIKKDNKDLILELLNVSNKQKLIFFDALTHYGQNVFENDINYLEELIGSHSLSELGIDRSDISIDIDRYIIYCYDKYINELSGLMFADELIPATHQYLSLFRIKEENKNGKPNDIE